MNISFCKSFIFPLIFGIFRIKMQIPLQNHVFFYNNALAFFGKIQYNIVRSEFVCLINRS